MVAVLRAPDVAGALDAGGVTSIEITYSTPDARAAAFRTAVQKWRAA